MTDDLFILLSVFVAASPVFIVMFMDWTVGIESRAKIIIIKITPALSSIGGLLFIMSSLFLASITVGEIAGLGILPGLVVWYAIQKGVTEITVELLNKVGKDE